MSNRTVSTNQLTNGAYFAVRGNVSFSRIATRIEGDELEQDKQRRRARGWIPVERPYTTMTINNARVIYYHGPQNKRNEEIYAEESLYTSQRNAGAGFFFSAQNRGRKLPWVGVLDADGKTVNQVPNLEGELANGLDVTLIMRVFQGKPNKGVSLDGVIVHEPIRYFNFEQPGNGLSELGLKFNPAPVQTPAQYPATTAPAQPESAANYGYDDSGYDDNEQPYGQEAFSSTPQRPQQPQRAQMPANPYGGNGNGIVYTPQNGGRNY